MFGSNVTYHMNVLFEINRYFSKAEAKELLERVPFTFLLMGFIFLIMQFVGCMLLTSPRRQVRCGYSKCGYINVVI